MGCSGDSGEGNRENTTGGERTGTGGTGAVPTTGGMGAVPGSGGLPTTGGAPGSGGLLPTGGVPGSGGLPTGGLPGSGGVLPTGGVSTGGMSTGGVSTGGLATGGVSTGGLATGGVPTGGELPTGGVSTGGFATGGVSTGGVGTGGAPASFQPCPETGPCKILPLGDSITVGLGFDGGYRVELFHLALSDEHDITFTGTQTPNGPPTVDGITFPTNHEGISGQTIQQIADRIPSPGLNEMPHIVLLHAGTNDMWAGANGADTRLGSLLDELIADAPDALIVVSNIIPFPQAASSVATFNASVPGLVQARADAGAHIVFVDQFEGFPEGELGDGVHPNQAGYARMAAKWYDAIDSYLR